MSESDYEYLDRLYEQIDELQSQVASINKALDKACTYLHFGFININYHLLDNLPHISESRVPFMTEEQWKEWCMKDE